MGHKIVFTTGNEGKMKEVRLTLADLGLGVLSMKKAEVDLDIARDGKTFKGNAAIKARAVWEKTDGIVLAGDSGLVIDYLDEEPGIYSAWYLGEGTSHECKNQVILERMEKAQGEERLAKSISAIATVLPDGRELGTLGIVEGVIAGGPAGDGGFGCDLIFYLPEFGMASAEIPIELKNEISHRGKALMVMKDKIRKVFKEEHRRKFWL